MKDIALAMKYVYITAETLEAMKERIPEACINPRKDRALSEHRKRTEDIIARKSGCVTREEARAFAKEELTERRKQYEGIKDFYDVENSLGVSGKAPSSFNYDEQAWRFYLWNNELGLDLRVIVSCDGGRVKTWSSNR